MAAARGQRQAVAYEIAQTRLVLAQGVATYYRQWQLLVQQKAIVQQRQQLNQVRERVVKELIRAEQVPPSQLYAVLQGNLRFATALSDLDGKVAQVRHGLAALTGQQPGALDAFEPAPVGVLPSPPVDRLTAGLLGKRPDLAAQREVLEIRRHQIAGAKTAFYPNITIKALAGLSDLEIGNLPNSSSLIAGVLPSISLPIFTSGALQANLSKTEATFDEQASRYNKSVYAALREAADTLVDYDTATRALAQQQEMLALAHKTVAAERSRYRAGLTNRLELVNAEDEVLQAEGQLSQLQSQQHVAWLAMNVVFGGGFDGADASGTGGTR